MVCVRETVYLLCGTDWVLKNTSLNSENYVHKHSDGKNIIVIYMQTMRVTFSAVDFNLRTGEKKAIYRHMQATLIWDSFNRIFCRKLQEINI